MFIASSLLSALFISLVSKAAFVGSRILSCTRLFISSINDCLMFCILIIPDMKLPTFINSTWQLPNFREKYGYCRIQSEKVGNFLKIKV